MEPSLVPHAEGLKGPNHFGSAYWEKTVSVKNACLRNGYGRNCLCGFANLQ